MSNFLWTLDKPPSYRYYVDMSNKRRTQHNPSPTPDVDEIFGHTTSAVRMADERPVHPDLPDDEEYLDLGPDEDDLPPPPALPSNSPTDLVLPDDDGFLETERRLYETALSVYENALSSGNDKLRMQAAKDVVSIYTGRRDATLKGKQATGGGGNSHNHLHITVDSVRAALAAARNVGQGQGAVNEQRTADRPVDLDGGNH